MIGSHHRISGAIVAPLRHRARGLAALLALFVVLGVTSLAAAAAIGRGGGVEPFAATFEARAVGDPEAASCPALGPGGLKTEARYRGTMTVDGDEFTLNFTLEALVDRSVGLGAAEGRWQLTDPGTSDIVARGQVIGVVEGLDPAHLELIGLLMGQVDPPEPDLPAQTLLGNVAVSITDGTHLTGAVGDPQGMPSNGLLLPAVRC